VEGVYKLYIIDIINTINHNCCQIVEERATILSSFRTFGDHCSNTFSAESIIIKKNALHDE